LDEKQKIVKFLSLHNTLCKQELQNVFIFSKFTKRIKNGNESHVIFIAFAGGNSYHHKVINGSER